MSNLSIRASAFGRLFDCAYRFEGEHILGMRKAASPRMLLGSAIHASTAAFDQGRVSGSQVSVDDAAAAAVDLLRKPEYDVDWTGADLSPRDAEAIALRLHVDYCTTWSPRFQFESVEMTMVPLVVDCGGGTTITLTGTMDRARVRSALDGGRGITDLKTGARAVSGGRAETKNHRAQLGTYELLYQNTTGQSITEPAEIIGLKTKGRPEIAAADVHGARELLVGNEFHRGLIEYAAEMFRTGLFTPNNQSLYCQEKSCARWAKCAFHD